MKVVRSYYLEYATPSDFREVVDFYSDSERRTEAVYFRNEDIIKSQLNKRLRVVVRDNETNVIVASSAIHTLSDGENIDCIAKPDGQTAERGRVGELMGVLAFGHGKNDPEIARGIWHIILFGVPMITAFDRASSDQLPIDILVADVQTHRVNTINHITGATSTKSPMKWELINPADQLVQAFKDTTSDKNVDRQKNFYRAPVGNLPCVAQYLQHRAKRGYITNHKGEKILVDFSRLGLEETMSNILERKWYFTKLLHNSSWSEARRTFNSIVPSDVPSRQNGSNWMARGHAGEGRLAAGVR